MHQTACEGISAYLFSKVLEQWDISPVFHVGSLVLADLLVLGLLGVLVKGTEEVFVDDEVLIALGVVNFNVGEIGVHAKGKVGGEGPGSGCPRKKRGFGVIDQWEGNRD